ncbi:DUF3054 domain-containing protein [Kribbia dieselivorans]|uniref:DUF3054 domain-containing protein n=1 Tax=Kribbia dieselivorans TaxID=331526 RepID=UPI0009FB4DFD|nr:DUF3054 domain-containing protein [Kribbia dieselivorans]
MTSAATETTRRPRRSAATPGWALLIDLVCVVVFALVGRASHAEGLTLGGVADTAWPFVVALGLGWLAARALWQVWPVLMRHAWLVWLVTVVGGMLLRRVSGDGTAVAFVIVATLFLGATLIGWRLLASLVVRRS